ncbi:hypothetical protein Tco_0042095, partial [Tanacetum coccineum]
MIHPQSSQVIHPQSSQAPAISLQSSADPIQFDSGLVVLYFLPTDDPLECLNKALAFMYSKLCGNCSTSNDHITRQYTQSKKVQWLKQKMMFAQLQEEARIQLSKEQLAILADAGERVDSGLGAFIVITNALFQLDGIDLYDSDCDEVPTAQANFMKNLSSSDSEVLSE